MLHVPFRHQNELLSGNTTFAAAYADFLQSGIIPSSLEDDIHRLQELSEQPSQDDDTEVDLQYYTLLDTQYHALLCMHLHVDITLFYLSGSE